MQVCQDKSIQGLQTHASVDGMSLTYTPPTKRIYTCAAVQKVIKSKCIIMLYNRMSFLYIIMIKYSSGQSWSATWNMIACMYVCMYILISLSSIHTGICIAKHTYRYHCSIPLLHPHDGYIQIEVQTGSTRGRTPQTPGSPDEALDLFLGHILHSSTLFLHPGTPAADRLHEHH